MAFCHVASCILIWNSVELFHKESTEMLFPFKKVNIFLIYFKISAARTVISLLAKINFKILIDVPCPIQQNLGWDKHCKGISPPNALFDCLLMVISLICLTSLSFSYFATDLAPVASSLCVRYSHRAVVITGGFLAFSGMALGFFGLNMVWMYATTGFLQGMTFLLYGFLSPATQSAVLCCAVLMVGVLKYDFCFDFMSN